MTITSNITGEKIEIALIIGKRDLGTLTVLKLPVKEMAGRVKFLLARI